MRNKVGIFLAAALMLALLTACGDKKEEAPAVYAVGEDQVVSLDSIIDEGEALLASVEAPTEAAAEAGVESYTYHYNQIEDPALMAAEYIGVLRGGEQGFNVTDQENRMLADEPELETLTGTVLLEKMSAVEPAEGESKKIFQVVVAWSEFALAIQVSHQEGTILPPLEEETEEPAQPKALTEQLEYFNGLNPEKLGLEGDDMHDYTVYPKTGWVLVDSFSCRELNIYLEDALDGTNVFMGTFYLSSDLQHLYKRMDDNSIVQMELDD